MKNNKFVFNVIAIVVASIMSFGCASSDDLKEKSTLDKIERSEAIYTKDNNHGFLPGYDVDIIDATKVLPNPAEVTQSRYFYDWYNFYKEGEKRDSDRGKLAIEDVLLTIDYVSLFSDAYGIEISLANTPELWELMQNAATCIYKVNKKAKNHFKRIRPYVQLNESTGYAKDEEDSRKSYSYPSSHTALGWGTALILAEINPNRQNEIFEKGYEFGQSRVILGYHYQSDVDAARLVAAMAVSSLHTSNQFMTQLQKAKQEFNQKISEK